MAKPKPKGKAPIRRNVTGGGKVLVNTPRYARTWENRIKGGLEFLREIKALPDKMADTWTKGNDRHYRKLVADLIAKPPKGFATKARRFARDLKNI